jgi:hypothetical protein
MTCMPPTLQRILTLAVASLLYLPAQAVTFYSTGDPAFNTTAPTGAYLDSGWQWEGLLERGGSKFLGTAIGPHCFITAKHLAVNTSWTFSYEGQTFAVAAVTNDPGSDLAVCYVSGTFADYAPLYTGSAEAGQTCVVLGRGTDRGAAVTNLDLQLAGWKWGAVSSTERWGLNVIEETGVADGNPYLAANFDAAGGASEGMLTGGDSGGGLFLEDGGTWKLAGINWTVFPNLFNTTASDVGSFNAALFDCGGLYYKGSSGWHYLPNSAPDIPESFYATRISTQADWIASVIPEPSGVFIMGLCALLAGRSFRRWRS